jgi:nitrous oxidase accessory protein NosD
MSISPARLLRGAVVLAMALASGFNLSVGTTRAETTQCTPLTALPVTISSPGVYCLTSDLNVNLPSQSTAITIEANSVVIDLNGHRIANLAGPGTLATGISALERQNITIRNGSIRGFLYGIFLVGPNAAGHVIEDLRIYRCTFKGIEVWGLGSVVRRNQVLTTGPGPFNFLENGFGILVDGSGTRVIDNDVVFVRGSLGDSGIAIHVSGEDGMVVNNRVTDAAFGILLWPGSGVKYRDNLTTNVGTPYRGGTDAGNNH